MQNLFDLSTKEEDQHFMSMSIRRRIQERHIYNNKRSDSLNNKRKEAIMSMEYNYFVEKESYTRERERELPIRAYTNQTSYPPSRETRADEFQRYPSFSKIFNNRPSFGETDFGARNMIQKAPFEPSQSLPKRGGSHQQKVRFVEERDETGKKKEVDHVEEQSVDREADGFINWKRKNLQMCRTFAD